MSASGVVVDHAAQFHTTVATVVQRTADLAVAAEQLSHSNVKITARHYVQRPEAATDRSSALEAFGR